MIKAVTFDWWFTITNMPVPPEEFAIWAKDRRLKGMSEVLLKEGFDVSSRRLSEAYDLLSKDLKAAWDRNMDIAGEEQMALFLQHAGFKKTEDSGLIAKLRVPFSNALLDRPPSMNDGIVECISTLRKDGYGLGIISNTGRTWGRVLVELQRRYNIIGSFEVMSFSDEIGIRKPHPGIFKKTLGGLKLPPQNVVHVGDNVIDDVKGAKGVGMKAVWYNNGIWPGAKTDEADAEIHHLSELPEIVRRL